MIFTDMLLYCTLYDNLSNVEVVDIDKHIEIRLMIN